MWLFCPKEAENTGSLWYNQSFFVGELYIIISLTYYLERLLKFILRVTKSNIPTIQKPGN